MARVSVSFLARPKPRISFLGLSLLRNSTETLATQARVKEVVLAGGIPWYYRG